jgi:hypothetical protein
VGGSSFGHAHRIAKLPHIFLRSLNMFNVIRRLSAIGRQPSSNPNARSVSAEADGDFTRISQPSTNFILADGREQAADGCNSSLQTDIYVRSRTAYESSTAAGNYKLRFLAIPRWEGSGGVERQSSRTAEQQSGRGGRRGEGEWKCRITRPLVGLVGVNRRQI